jgi:CheY-like chemotaxis protein
MDALNMAKRIKPHLIVLDQLLPGKKGTEICRELKANSDTAHIPVLFFTAHSSLGFEEECAALGAAIVLYKPVVAELVHAIQIVLSGKRLKWLEGE